MQNVTTRFSCLVVESVGELVPYDSADSSEVEGHWDPVVEEGALEQFDTKEVNYISIFFKKNIYLQDSSGELH